MLTLKSPGKVHSNKKYWNPASLDGVSCSSYVLHALTIHYEWTQATVVAFLFLTGTGCRKLMLLFFLLPTVTGCLQMDTSCGCFFFTGCWLLLLLDTVLFLFILRYPKGLIPFNYL